MSTPTDKRSYVGDIDGRPWADSADIVDRLKADPITDPKHTSELVVEAVREIERLRNFVNFVNVWCYRESNVSAAERLEAIQYHPTARLAYQQR